MQPSNMRPKNVCCTTAGVDVIARSWVITSYYTVVPTCREAKKNENVINIGLKHSHKLRALVPACATWGGQSE
jgi:hypothetical protein